MKTLKQTGGFALVLVLIVIVLATTMCVFFLASAGRERRAVDLYARSNESNHLASMAINRVMGQIGAATKEGTVAAPVSWASQPGMIRTFAPGSAQAKNIYKLYSWDSLVELGTGFNPASAAQLPPATWTTDTAIYVDLNQPIDDTYPILDPAAVGYVEGFAIDDSNPIVTSSTSEAPMPVKWLYVLRDGRMVPATGGSGTTATVATATAINPIIGRVAYWTDDETSKVNINTASEGSFWDVPRSGSRDDVQFAGNPPVNNEFQRTPGHPAMTSLSAVFPEFITEHPSDSIMTRWNPQYAIEVEKIYNMTPRISWGKTGTPIEGSRGGTFPVSTFTLNYGPARGAFPDAILPKKITLDSDRLYATADELWFQAPILGASTGLRLMQPSLDGTLQGEPNAENSDKFKQRLFFLTASSRAPETTIFETPRVSMWPVTWPNKSSYFPSRESQFGSGSNSLPVKYRSPTPQDPNTTKLTDINPVWITPQERLLAFCATLNSQAADGGDRYYFQRKDPDSPINDWLSITRNRDLVQYLLGQMRKEAPGFGGSLQDGLENPATTAWLAFNILDYIRAFVNQYTALDAAEGVRYSFTGVSFRRGRIGTRERTIHNEPNAKMPSSLRANIEGVEHRGIGAFPALEEASLVFYAAERREPVPPSLPGGITDPEAPNYPEWRNPYNWSNLINLDSTNGYPVGTQTTKMRAVMLLDFTGLEPGTSIKPTVWVKVRGNSFRVNGSSIGFPDPLGLSAQVTIDTSANQGASTTPLFLAGKPKVFSNSANGANVWQLVSGDIDVNPSDLEFGFQGSSITIEVYTGNPLDLNQDPTNDPNRKVYEKVMRFERWDGNLPVPMAPRWTLASRAYRFKDDESNPGKVVENARPAGSLPGGTLRKEQPVPPVAPPLPTAKANMEKFTRTIPTGPSSKAPIRSHLSDSVETLPNFDLWLPNPDYRTTVDQATGPTTNWAWSEFAPSIGSRSGSLVPDIRSNNGIFQFRGNSTTYAYRTSNQAGWSRDIADPDDARESGQSLRNCSTNFRKRVAAVQQRNTNARPAFCVEGIAAVAPFDHTDPNAFHNPSGGQGFRSDYFMQTNEGALQDNHALITPYDTVISMINALPIAGGQFGDRDPRLAQIPGNDDYQRISVVLSSQQPTTVIDAKYPRNTVRAQWHGFGTPGILPNITGYQILPTYRNKPFARSGVAGGSEGGGSLGGGTTASRLTGQVGNMPGAEVGTRNRLPDVGDWTSLPGRYPDGGRLMRPDQEYGHISERDTTGGMYVPYWPRKTYGDNLAGVPSGADASALSYFSPNRQVPSPVLLGTIPRSRTIGWQTLAFSPNPADPNHPGIALNSTSAPDHVLLDLLWMPVAEPYPISDQLSTAGKVNLNYQLMPFPYIERKTALHAAMKNVWMTALTENDNMVANHKSHFLVRDQPGSKTRYAIDVDQTLLGFDEIFGAGQIFRSASQLCEMYMVPQGGNLANTRTTFWNGMGMTADNAREQPYDHLYSRITTKSNTYTVHWRAQVLRKVPGTSPTVWDDARDRVASESRGSTLIERYIDSNATDIPDYATEPDAVPLGNFYKWRIVSDTLFQP